MDWGDLNLLLPDAAAEGHFPGHQKARWRQLHHRQFRRINAIEEKLEVRSFDRQPTGYCNDRSRRSPEAFNLTRIDDEVITLSSELLGKDLRCYRVTISHYRTRDASPYADCPRM